MRKFFAFVAASACALAALPAHACGGGGLFYQGERLPVGEVQKPAEHVLQSGERIQIWREPMPNPARGPAIRYTLRFANGKTLYAFPGPLLRSVGGCNETHFSAAKP